MSALEIPAMLMRERSASWKIVASTFNPGQASSGAFPFGRLDGGGLWFAQWNDINLRTADHVRVWRAISAIAENGVVPLVVPQCDRRHFPAPIVSGSPLYSYGDVPHSDGSYFDDDSGYAQPVVVVESVGAAALRATTLVLDIISGSALRGGEIFSIDHPTQGWRRYEIKTISVGSDGNSPPGELYTVTFRPPLREAVADGTLVEFDMPRCVMRLATPGSMDLELDLRRHGSPSASFIEYLYPAS